MSGTGSGDRGQEARPFGLGHFQCSGPDEGHAAGGGEGRASGEET